MSTATLVSPFLDPRPARWRLGLVTLASDPTIEDSIKRMLAQTTEVSVHYNRIAFDGGISVENLKTMQSSIRQTAENILPGRPLDGVMYGCTSASAAIGDDKVKELLRQAKPMAAAVTPVSGAVAAFQALGVRRISVLSPYPISVTDMLANYLRGLGLHISALHCLGLEDDWDNGCVSAQTLYDLVTQIDHRDADAIFLSCTALRGAEVAERVEKQLGLPVITSNQAMLWHALRQSGCPTKLQGFGQLMLI